MSWGVCWQEKRLEIKGIEGEGIHTLEMVSQYRLFNTAEYPLFRLIQDIVRHPHDVRKNINEYVKQVYS